MRKIRNYFLEQKIKTLNFHSLCSRKIIIS